MRSAWKNPWLLGPVGGIALTILSTGLLSISVERPGQAIVVIPLSLGGAVVAGLVTASLMRRLNDRQEALIRDRVRREFQYEERYRDLIENANDIIFTTDLVGRIDSFNRAGERITGYTREEIRGLTLHDLAELNERTINRCLKSDQSMTIEMVILSKSGENVHLEVSTRPLRREGKPVGVEGIARDVTLRKRLEEETRQSAKMQAFGQLAGGVAHDFNNLLTVINGNAQLLLSRLEGDAMGAELLDEIGKAGEQAALLTRQLLAFSRKQILAPVTLDLNAIIHDLQKLLRRLIPENIEVELALDPFLMNVKADPGLMTQMMLNLALNSRDAMPRGGKLTFRTINGNNGWTRLEVEDDGCGMDEATRKRIFEPFFTTKSVGAGTGLGLSTVYNIVQQSNGRIEVESTVGEGTLFRVYLPCSGSVPMVQAPVKSEIPAGGNETILLVEDEDCIRLLARRVLEMKGYTVLAAENGPKALSIFDLHSETIQLVLTDVVMPEMGGRELADILRDRRPDLRVVFMSGYTTDEVLRHGIETEQVEFLQKPFSPDALARKIQSAFAYRGSVT